MRLYQVTTMRTGHVERHVAKSAEAFRTISEVAAELDVPQHVLRFWESKFSQIKPMKRAGGRRYYRPADVDLLRGIRILLYSDGYTIKGVQKVLKEKGLRFVAEIGQSLSSSVQGSDSGHAAPAERDHAPQLNTSAGTARTGDAGVSQNDAAEQNRDQLSLPAPGAASEDAEMGGTATAQPVAATPALSATERTAVQNALKDLEAIARALRALGQ